jgi:Fe-S-cluster containining protein
MSKTKWRRRADGVYQIDCTGCPGLCCRQTAALHTANLPVTSEGHCAHLGEDSRCTIYETRPPICRVGHLFPLLQSIGAASTMNEYMDLNVSICDRLKAEHADRQRR